MKDFVGCGPIASVACASCCIGSVDVAHLADLTLAAQRTYHKHLSQDHEYGVDVEDIASLLSLSPPLSPGAVGQAAAHADSSAFEFLSLGEFLPHDRGRGRAADNARIVTRRPVPGMAAAASRQCVAAALSPMATSPPHSSEPSCDEDVAACPASDSASEVSEGDVTWRGAPGAFRRACSASATVGDRDVLVQHGGTSATHGRKRLTCV